MAVLDVPAAGAHLNRSGGVAQRLVVAWQHPENRSINPVGFLTFDGQAYQFAYIRNALQVEGFRPLLGFADMYGEYTSGDLFPLFAQRAMDPRRPDYQRYVGRLGLAGDPGPWEQITRSEGRRQGDTLQMLPEPSVVGDTLSGPFLVHGMRYLPREKVEAALRALKPKDELALADEPDNPVNPLALQVLGLSVPVGWVPDLLVEDMRTLMQQATVSVRVEHVNGPDAPWHLRLLARLDASPANGFRFFTGERWTPLAGESV
jgi:hypothetical protein